jgi:hypothetical protein
MFVQNYDSNTAVQDIPSKIERTQPSVIINRRTPSVQRRASIKSSDSNLGIKPTLGDITTQIATATTTITPIEQAKVESTTEQNLMSTTTDSKQDLVESSNDLQPRLGVVDTRKRIKKGAFDPSDSVNDFVAFELGLMGRRSAMQKKQVRFGKENQNGEATETTAENQATLDLLEKIRQSASGLAVGQSPLSQQVRIFKPSLIHFFLSL